jgi:hypothetical protein
MLTLDERIRRKKLETRVTELEKERYTVKQIRKDMRKIITEIVKDVIEIKVEPVSVDEQLRDLLKE